MKEFFSQSGFGKQLEVSSTKTNKIVQGQSVYRADDNMGNNIKKGNLFYLDNLHKDHIEVFNKRGDFIHVLNLDGSINDSKTEAVNKQKRKLK
ncbi:Uncharacterised protein [Oligella ureolytica]|uniref:Uncharacterized protein n=1 Tax=Oligella ureolytica TaxID=90244 RepID=A0A378XF35_9BURK|nr:hypothetical protein [Oligella ureolytica]QPT40972.1 hypothetical protein I6G29_05285 [Oligella ureolytica]SUA53331.1 Uncharacterised protein [Oligella ureolytica]